MDKRSRKLLLVEDEALIAMNQRMQLEKIGYDVHHVLTGEAAVSYTLDPETRPELVLMDIDLGNGIDGTQAAEQILAEIEIPILFVSSHTEPAVVEKTEKITSYGYVVKNSGITVLDASIKMAFKLFEAKMQEQRYKTDLLHSRDLMKYIIEHTRAAVSVHDRDLNYIYVSKQYLDQFHVKDRDVIGKRHYEVFPDLPQKLRDAHQRALRGEVSKGEDDPYELEDGTILWTRWECRPWYETDDSIGGFIVYAEVLSSTRAENAKTRASLDYLRSILRTTRDGFAVVDMDGHFLEVNEAACEMYGYRRDEFLQLSLWDLTMEYLPQLSAERIDYLRRSGHALFEVRNRCKDGSTLDVEVSTSFLGGEEDRIVMFIRDISERKQAEERLRQVLNEYDTVFNGTQDGMFLVDVIDEDTYRYIRNNRAHAEASGITLEQIANKTPQELLGKDLGDEIAAKYRRCYQAGHPISYEETLDLPGGEKTWFTTLTPIFDQGEIQHIVGATHDITERQKTEERLKESEARWKFALEAAGDGVWDWNAETNRVFFSERWKRMLGYEPDEIGDSFHEWESRIHPDDRDASLADLQEHLSGSTPLYENEHRLRHKDGSYTWMLDRGKVLQWSEDGKPLRVIGNHIDISRRKRADDEIQRQLAEKETVLKEVHHRIKNNMAQIESLLSIQASSAESADVTAALNTAMSRVRSTRILYEKLLVGKGHEHVSMKEYLESLIDAHVDVYNDTAGVIVEKHIDDFALSSKRAVPVGIILNELLTNVFKYAFGGRAEGRVMITLEKRATQAVLTVQDDGIGFDERVAANQSTGFGLTLTRMLAEQLDGTFTIESENGTKSVVAFEL